MRRFKRQDLLFLPSFSLRISAEEGGVNGSSESRGDGLALLSSDRRRPCRLPLTIGSWTWVNSPRLRSGSCLCAQAVLCSSQEDGLPGPDKTGLGLSGDFIDGSCVAWKSLSYIFNLELTKLKNHTILFF